MAMVDSVVADELACSAPAGEVGPLTGLSLEILSGPGAGRRVRLRGGRHCLGRGAECDIRLEDSDVSRRHLTVVVAPVRDADHDFCIHVADCNSTNGSTLIPIGQPPVEVSDELTIWPIGTPLRLGRTTVVVRTHREDATARGSDAVRKAEPHKGISAPPDVTQPGSARPGSAQPRSAPPATAPPGTVVPLRVADDRDTMVIKRSPRIRLPQPSGSFRFPQPPASPKQLRLPWPVFVLPLVVSLPLALVMRQPTFLLFAVMSPVAAFAQWWYDKRQRTGEHLKEFDDYQQQCDDLDQLIDTRLHEFSQWSHDTYPDLALLSRSAAERSSMLWQVRPEDEDAVHVRLGIADQPSTITVERDGGTETKSATAIPFVVPMTSCGPVGICGPPAACRRMVAAIVGQLATRLSPMELGISVSDHDTYRGLVWVSRLPHAAGAARPRLPWLLHIGDEIADAATVSEGSDVSGWRDSQVRTQHLSVSLASRRDDLPSGCQSVIELDVSDSDGLGSDGLDAGRRGGGQRGSSHRRQAHRVNQGVGALATLHRNGQQPVTFIADLPTPAWWRQLIDDLAPLQDARQLDTAGHQARLPELLGYPTPNLLVSLWNKHSSPGASALLGTGAGKPLWLDLDRDGPHALVAGTTGSGKSELLISWVAAMAVQHPPDQLAFLLVDYKGGTAFSRLDGLPHVTGLITDLDPAQSGRVLQSLQAELRRRERLLRDSEHSDGKSLPRLVIVVDEFRVLAEEHPQVLASLIRVATLGRGLGVHLILATQRPAGVVSPEIRANTNLRIGLRMRERGDSADVLDSDAAAATLPAGAGFIRVGADDLQPLSVAMLPKDETPQSKSSNTATATTTDAAARESAEAKKLSGANTPDSSTLPRTAGKTDGTDATDSIDESPNSIGGNEATTASEAFTSDETYTARHLITAITSAMHASQRQPLPPAWLPELPSVVKFSQLHQLLTPSETAADTPMLAYAMGDVPHQQARCVLSWDLARDGHLAILGTPRSGRTTMVRTLIHAAAQHNRCHSHRITSQSDDAETASRLRPIVCDIIDATGGLRDLADENRYPHVGTLTRPDDERAYQLIRELAQTTGHPHATNHPTTTDHPPDRLLIIDGWESAEQAWSSLDGGTMISEVIRLARDGAGSGLRLVVTGERALLSGDLASVLTYRVLLSPANGTLALLAGVPAKQVPRQCPVGRMLRLPAASTETDDYLTAQIALADPEPSTKPTPEPEPEPVPGLEPELGLEPGSELEPGITFESLAGRLAESETSESQSAAAADAADTADNGAHAPFSHVPRQWSHRADPNNPDPPKHDTPKNCAPKNAAGAEKMPGIIRLRELPTQVKLPDLLSQLPESSQHETFFAVGGDAAGPIAVPHTPTLLVSGPCGSGRTTTLVSLAAALAHSGRKTVLVTHHLAGHEQLQQTYPLINLLPYNENCVASVRRALVDAQPPVLLLDDDVLDDPQLEDLALSYARGGADTETNPSKPTQPPKSPQQQPTQRPTSTQPPMSHHQPSLRVVASCESSIATNAFRGLIHQLRHNATGIVLGGRTRAAAVFPATASAAPAGPPGRGVLVLRHETTRIQVATPWA